MREVLTATFTRLSQGKIDKIEAAIKVLNTVDKVSAVSDVEVNEGSASVTLPTTVEVTLKSGEKVQKAVEWNKSNVDLSKPGTYAVKGDVADTDLEASVNVVVKAVAPEVTSVSAINASQLEVKFNKAVDVATAETITNYVLTKADGNTIAVTDAAVQEDGKTVVLTVAPITSKTSFTVRVANVKLDGSLVNVFPLYSHVLTVEDTTNAVIKDVIAKTNSDVATTATIYFSEPVSGGALKVDGSTVAYVLAADGLSATISTNLDASKTHTLEAINLTDTANNINTSTTKTFTVTKDVSAPTFSVSTESDSTIVLTFDKAVDANSVNSASIVLKDEGLDTVAGYSVSVPAGYSNKRVEIALPASTYGTKTTRNFTILASDAVKDSLGNKLAATQKTVSISKDATAPNLVGVEYTKDANGVVNNVLFKYDEKINETANLGLTATNYTTGAAVDLFGTLAASDVDVLADGKTVKVAVQGSDSVKSGKLELATPAGFVNDTALTHVASKVKKYVVDFGAASATPLKVQSVAPTTNRNEYIVRFDDVVTYASATNPSNYSVNGVALPANTAIAFDATNKDRVTVTLPANFVAADDTGAVLRATNVETSAGTKVTANTNVIVVDDNTSPTIDRAKSSINANGTLTLGFSESVNAVAAGTLADLALSVNGSPVTVGNGNVSIADGNGSDAGKYVVTFTTDVTQMADTSGKFYEYLDVNGNNTLDSSDIVVKSHTAALTAGTFNLNTLSALKVATGASPATITDRNNVPNLTAANQSVVIK